MIALVTLEHAKRQLHRIDDYDDVDIQDKIFMASAIVMDYLKLSAIPSTWTIGSPATTDVPYLVQAAVLLVAGELYMNREASIAEVLSPAVLALLHRLRDPAMA